MGGSDELIQKSGADVEMNVPRCAQTLDSPSFAFFYPSFTIIVTFSIMARRKDEILSKLHNYQAAFESKTVSFRDY